MRRRLPLIRPSPFDPLGGFEHEVVTMTVLTVGDSSSAAKLHKLAHGAILHNGAAGLAPWRDEYKNYSSDQDASEN